MPYNLLNELTERQMTVVGYGLGVDLDIFK